ncbi:MAG: GIY-YIG nuclease family protein, partial [Candidatus Marinimicrobia bacterium]|nr:GIY-YIG nuclease family protein [Candidatus Neomarinimicrobiota bacterium]
ESPMRYKMWSVYVLRSLRDGRYYVGMSEDVQKRLRTHNMGKVSSTKSRRPFELIYTQECSNRETARDMEKYLKTSAGNLLVLQLNFKTI